MSINVWTNFNIHYKNKTKYFYAKVTKKTIALCLFLTDSTIAIISIILKNQKTWRYKDNHKTIQAEPDNLRPHFPAPNHSKQSQLSQMHQPKWSHFYTDYFKLLEYSFEGQMLRDPIIQLNDFSLRSDLELHRNLNLSQKLDKEY